MTTEIIEITDINVSFANPIVEREQMSDGRYYNTYNRLTATVKGANNQPINIAGIPLTITGTHSYIGNLSTIYTVTDSNGKWWPAGFSTATGSLSPGMKTCSTIY